MRTGISCKSDFCFYIHDHILKAGLQPLGEDGFQYFDLVTAVVGPKKCEAFVDVLERWSDASDIFNMDRNVDLADGTTITFRQYLRNEGFKLATAKERTVLLDAQQPMGGITI